MVTCLQTTQLKTNQSQPKTDANQLISDKFCSQPVSTLLYLYPIQYWVYWIYPQFNSEFNSIIDWLISSMPSIVNNWMGPVMSCHVMTSLSVFLPEKWEKKRLYSTCMPLSWGLQLKVENPYKDCIFVTFWSAIKAGLWFIRLLMRQAALQNMVQLN